jgi:hypothetical protein
VIASAAYGSELAPEVQFLRGFRDRSVTSSFAGRQFMNVFNEFYYSFSPTVARLTASHRFLSAGVRALIYPLVGSLHVAATAFQEIRQFNLELAILLSGVLASCLIGIAYVSPIMIMWAFLKRQPRSRRMTR